MGRRPDYDARFFEPEPADPAESGVSRRGFLRGAGTALGAGALGATAGRTLDRDMAPIHRRGGGGPDPAFFGRMFPNMQTFAEPTDALREAMRDIGKPGGIMDAADDLAAGPTLLITDLTLSEVNRNNDAQTAGVTFYGQFLDHDLTFDAASPLGEPVEPSESRNTRTPIIDLDSLYGGGPTVSPMLYDQADRAKLRIESGGQFEDVPRTADGAAIIGDQRNDEHMILSGLHAAFIMFHNNVVDWVREEGGITGRQAFSAARETVVRHHQWITVHEFLPLILGQERTDQIFRRRRFYRPSRAYMPVEFQGAAYRFGHSMVRPSYRANLLGDNGEPFFAFIFDPAGEGQADPVDLRGGARAPRRFIGWGTFFDFGDGNVRPNKRIDTKLSTPLFDLPLPAIPSEDPPTALPQRNLLRHITWSLPSGQAIAQAMGVEQLQAADLSELSGYSLGLESNTPLWYYVLKEAELMNDGLTLGPVGGTIVGEVFAGVLQTDRGSYLSQQGWRPSLPTQNDTVTGEFTMLDLLHFAGVDPATRGQ